jgi:hypothetical protein
MTRAAGNQPPEVHRCALALRDEIAIHILEEHSRLICGSCTRPNKASPKVGLVHKIGCVDLDNILNVADPLAVMNQCLRRPSLKTTLFG